MIPSSDLPKLCSNNKCGKVMDVPLSGWRCKNNRDAKLCYECFVAFNRGSFCELYHKNSSGWRLCSTCKKRIHYGCKASKSLYVRSKPRGIKCIDCTPQHEILMRNRISRPGTPLQTISKGTSGNSTGNTEPSGSVSCHNRPEIKPTTPSVGKLIARGYVPSPTSGERMNEAEKLVVRKSITSTPQIISGVRNHASFPSKELTTPSCTPLPSVPPTVTDQENSFEKDDERPIGKSSTETKTRDRKPRSEHRYVPRLTDEELKQMSRGSNVEVTPLFEKVLTVSDTGKIGRLVLPKKCAEDHFPSIDIPEGRPLVFQDVEGKDLEFNFRYWPNNNSRMYVLEGFNYYVASMKLQAGDTVMFGRLESKGKLVMAHRKGTSASSCSQVSLFRKAKTASLSSQTAKTNMVSGSSSDEVSKRKTTPAMVSTFSREKQNDPIRVQSDVVGPKASHLVKRKHSEIGMITQSTRNGVSKDNRTSTMASRVSHEDPNDPINVHSDVVGSKSTIRAKRKNCEMKTLTTSTNKRFSRATAVLALLCPSSQKKPNDPKKVHSNTVEPKVLPVGRKRKHYEMGLTSKIDHEDKMANLDLTFKEGQELIRSGPGGNPPSEMMFEGVKLKSYKDDPVIGRPCMFTKHDQDTVQWAQCEKCYKWRKIPIDIPMPANWTCRQNDWDLLRSRCSAKEELTLDIINFIFSPINKQESSKKIRPRNLETEPVGTIEVAVTQMEKVVTSSEPSKANKKHPRHRPGCTCIVCMQAPSGSKHKSSCECCSCKTVKRRRVLNLRRGKKRSNNARHESRNTRSSTSNKKKEKALTQTENVPKLPDVGTSNSNPQMVVNGGSEVDQNANTSSEEVIKRSFDLNLLPESDEDDMDAVVTVQVNPPVAGNI